MNAQPSYIAVTCTIRMDEVYGEIELMFDTPHPFGKDADAHVEAAIFSLAERVYAQAIAMGIEVLMPPTTTCSTKAPAAAKYIDAWENKAGNLLIQFALKDDVQATAFKTAFG